MINSEILRPSFKSKIRYNENLSKYSWFGLGGPAEILFKPDNIEELSTFLIQAKKNRKTINIIGAGSNTLIRDGGIKGAIIKLSSKFSSIKILDNNIIEVGASSMDKKISDFASENSISGLEFLSCIPGSIGGGVIMNSGCYGEDISKILISFKAIDFSGNILEIKKEKINFQYRSANLPDDLIILSVKLQGRPGDKNQIIEKQLKLITDKKKNQPSKVKTCGSTFKNPKNKKAWELIKISDCNKLNIGDAKISDLHCNFFVNEGKASADQIEELINLVKKTVLLKTGVNLDLEIKIIGVKS